jgi:hypothetical protein
VTEPGIYAMPAATYHADPCPQPSLSSSIAKLIIQSSAAHARHEHPRLNPNAKAENGDHFDLGTAAHALLLEGDSGVAVLDYPDWRTNASKDARDQARAAGKTPLLRKTWADVEAMVGAAREQLARHKDGGAAMFTAGEPERTLVWRDDEFGGLWCRARLDWLRPVVTQVPGWAIDDYKSTGASANPDEWTRTMFSCAFDLQCAFYLRGLKALFPAVDATFRFAVQETFPPYALSVITLGPAAMTIAEKKCLYALDVWAHSMKKNDWRGYPRRTCYATLPPWHETWWLEKELAPR